MRSPLWTVNQLLLSTSGGHGTVINGDEVQVLSHREGTPPPRLSNDFVPWRLESVPSISESVTLLGVVEQP